MKVRVAKCKEKVQNMWREIIDMTGEKRKGIMYILLAAFFFSLMTAFVRFYVQLLAPWG